MKFKALIDGVHFNPKKGAVKIVLVGASHVSLDELTTLSPKDETIHVTLESEQTKLNYKPKPGDPITIEPGSREEKESEEARFLTRFPKETVAKLKEAAERLREGNVDGDEVKGGGQGGII